MSEKNVQSTQWTKSTIHKLNYDTYGTVAGLTGSIPNYGGGRAGGFTTIPPHPPESLQESYGHVRFQPAITHHVVAPPPPPPPTPTTVLMPLGAASSNVPALSGFVPPYNASGSTNVTSAATSVLTPNPFAVHSSSGSSNVTFGLEQFQHLNAHQQFEFTKMMTAMNTAAPFTSVTSTTATSICATPSGSLPSVQLSGGRQNVDLTSTSGTITSTIAENVLNAIRINSASMHNQGRSRVGVKLPDEDKLRSIQHLVESGIGDQAKQQVLQILERISTLKPVEKLVLYLRMPAETPESDPLRLPQNPLGTRSEISHTINWVRSHLEHDPQVSIPKQDVYNDYITFCDRLGIKPLSTADFGKVMKQVFPEIRPRRLGTRGNSRYCYAAMRKTTKLTTPQLPQLGTNFATKSVGCEPPMKTSSTAAADSSDCLDTSWQIVKMWAEKQLNIKVENLNSLAAHIQANHLMAAGSAVVQDPLIQKKISQREPKEKRPSGDFGPLKKRRKKKRKGSSSSESSCNQPQSNRAENSTKMSPVNTRCASSINMSEDEKKSIELIEVKQEVMDSPGYQKAPSTQRMASPNLQPVSITAPSAIFRDANKPHSYNQKPAHSPLQHNVQQLLPMNLATDSRTIHARAPSAGLQIPPINSTAVQNITPKIMDLSSPSTSQTSSAFGTTCVNEQAPIKEEVIDDYNTTNVFCKKVLKAQQTKGFWSNSPTHSTTITAASPSISVIAATSAIAAAGTSTDIVSSQTASYLMGPPPTQISTSTSPSAVPTEGSSIAAQPKVSSLNMMQLRAKKLRYYQIRESIAKGRASPSSDQATGDSTTEIDKDTDLPENLGLPRERVISICNMDKHELDDYFLPGEEENSQDQEAELLQYFQTGDAEEKPNSLDAAKTCNPTALHLPSLNNDKEHYAAGAANSYRPRGTQTHSNKVLPTDPAQALVANEGVTKAIAPGNINLNSAYVVAGNPPTHTPAVGSASASLALMSQKHQHQQQNKRKININTMMMIDNMNNSASRKNCIFLPISPNINNTTSSASTAASHSVMNGSDFFASPGLTRFRSKPAVLCKQQSLDCDVNFNSDPMICASRRRKSTYGASHPTILTNTSASAPPSPSVLQQKQVFGIQQQLNNSQWHITPGETSYTNIINHDPSLLVEQNSIDLDLFNAAADAAAANHSFEHDTILDAAAAANSIALMPFSETQQRSQSVPLSQLQRIHSPAFNRNFPTNFSTCTSVGQTPVPSEFEDFNMFCENSQHASTACTKEGSIKLETVGVLETDASAILDEVDVSDILSSPDFVSKFSNVLNSSNAATTTTCSSAGSSSGYSSGACTVFGGGISNSIISRSVPSTPLPHQQQYLFGGGGQFYDRQRPIDEIHLSPTVTAAVSAAGSLFTSNAKNISSQLLSRAAYDISKSMPTTPITTPRFRYSPVEFHRDFLINGNTIDSITSLPTMNVLNTDSFMNGGDLDAPNAETLIDDGGAGISSNAFTATATDAANSRMVVLASSFKEAASGLQVQHKTESRSKEFRLIYYILLYLFIEPLKYYIYIFT